VGKCLLTVLSLVLVFWNPRGLVNKVTEFKGELDAVGAAYAGVSESQTYKDGLALSDGKWKWEAGTEGRPSESGAGGVARGMGALINSEMAQASMIRKGKYTMWHRLELEGAEKALVVGVGYFPNAQDVKGHAAANKELRLAIAELVEQGYSVVFGGDLNAHTGANGDLTPSDTAGAMLLETVELSGMMLVNTMPGMCEGGPSRVQVMENEVQESTLDYIMCTTDLSPYITSMVIPGDQMGSDHRRCVLTMSGLSLKAPVKKGRREVWDIEAIPEPHTAEHSIWTAACRAKFNSWLRHTTNMLRGWHAADSTRTAAMGDMVEWSFQSALDELAAEQLGTKWIGPKGSAMLCSAARAAIAHRELCQDALRWVMHDNLAPEDARRDARVQFLAASRAVLAVAEKKKRVAELRLFRDVEAKQGDSKLFWGKFKAVRNSIVVQKSPPPVAIDASGATVTQPVLVLKAWRDFSASIASSDLTGSPEEGIYDEDFRDEVENRLAWLRAVRIHQPSLDKPFTMLEVFAAIRKLRMGAAPGEDGILADIVKSAAEAVGTNKLTPGNTMVEAMTVLFNFMFEHELWPERWSTGVISPLFKHDSRLDPANYRPITLLSIMGKLFGSVVNSRLAAFSETTGSISDEQGGFRRARGTPD